MNFIDLHNHCFAGMDDGVKSDEEALKMLEVALKSGIKLMYVTPHKEPKGQYNPEDDEVIKAWRHLSRIAKDNEIDIDIRYGEEFRIKTNSIDLIKSNQVLGYMDTQYVLVEFTRTNALSKLISQAIEAFQQQGRMILIAHPERYFDDVDEGVEACKSWVEKGCFLQLNRTSLTGVHGVFAEKIANKLIKLGLAHCIATDAHQAEGLRVCRLDDVYFMVKKKFSQADADLLFLTNPLLLSQNLPMQSLFRQRKRLKLISKILEKIKRPIKKMKKEGTEHGK